MLDLSPAELGEMSKNGWMMNGWKNGKKNKGIDRWRDEWMDLAMN